MSIYKPVIVMFRVKCDSLLTGFQIGESLREYFINHKIETPLVDDIAFGEFSELYELEKCIQDLNKYLV